jgi:hypothetical protein
MRVAIRVSADAEPWDEMVLQTTMIGTEEMVRERMRT